MKILFPTALLAIGLLATGAVAPAQAQPVPGYGYDRPHGPPPPPRHYHHRHYRRPPPPPYHGRELGPR